MQYKFAIIDYGKRLVYLFTKSSLRNRSNTILARIEAIVLISNAKENTLIGIGRAGFLAFLHHETAFLDTR